jgi:hypothetical protein
MGNFHGEPPLSQMLEDPVTQALMRSDGVDRHALQTLLRAARRRIAEAERPRPACRADA